jgi:hypothetical protein
MSASVSVMTGARYSEAKPFATCLEGGASSFAKASAGRGCRRRRWITERRGHAVSGGDGAPPSNTYCGDNTLKAALAAEVRVSTPNLVKRLLACFLTVLIDESRMIAISGLVFPSVIQ